MEEITYSCVCVCLCSVKEWIHCMQVCCQSRTTYSSPPIPQNVQLTSVPRLITPTTAPCNFMSNVQAPPPNQPHPSQAPPPHHPQYLHLPSHFTTQVRANNSSTHLLVATPTSSAVLVDTGYVSAESSPTLQTVWVSEFMGGSGVPFSGRVGSHSSL